MKAGYGGIAHQYQDVKFNVLGVFEIFASIVLILTAIYPIGDNVNPVLNFAFAGLTAALGSIAFLFSHRLPAWAFTGYLLTFVLLTIYGVYLDPGEAAEILCTAGLVFLSVFAGLFLTRRGLLIYLAVAVGVYLPGILRDPDTPNIILPLGVTAIICLAGVVTSVLVEKWRGSEVHYRMLAENSSGVVYRARSDGFICWVSPSVEIDLGYKMDAFIGHDALDFIHPDDHSAVIADRARARRQEPPVPLVVRFHKADGAWKFFSVTAKPFKGTDGEYDGAVVGLHDVDELTRKQAELETEQSFLKASIRSQLDPLVLFQPFYEDGVVTDFKVIDASDAACLAIKRSRDATVGSFLSAMPRAFGVEGMIPLLSRMLQTGEPLQVDDYSYLNDPLHRCYDLRAVSVGGAVSFTWRDVTSRHEEAARVLESETHYRLLAENSSDVIMHVQLGRVIWISPSLTSMLGWAPEQWQGRLIDDFIYPADFAALAHYRTALYTGGAATGVYRFQDTQGDYHWVEVHAKPFVNVHGNQEGVVASFRVIDDRVKVEAELEHRARYDELTELYNRAEVLSALSSRLPLSQRKSEGFTVLFCDVDDFKTVNDVYGHGAGDEVLRVLSQRVKTFLREHDMAARFGGDEIIVLLDAASSEDALKVADRIRALCRMPVRYGPDAIEATVSVGVAPAEPGDTVDSLIARADRAMYEAKRTGKDQVVLAGLLTPAACPLPRAPLPAEHADAV